MTVERERLEEILFNSSMADHDVESLEVRDLVQEAARQAVKEDFLSAHAGDEVETGLLDLAVEYAITLLYEAGSLMYHPDDIRRSIEVREGYRKLARDRGEYDGWMPQDEESLELVLDLIQRASALADNDREPAFSPHAEGRPHEILDSSEAKYNKFGILVR